MFWMEMDFCRHGDRSSFSQEVLVGAQEMMAEDNGWQLRYLGSNFSLSYHAKRASICLEYKSSLS